MLPLVDLPQHLHLISVLHRLDDASTLYPEIFRARGELTPYLGYYYAVSWLNWLLPLDLANRVFLSLVVAGLPLSLAFVLKSLKRQPWPALLALPFAYGDSLAWGFINYCAALPLALLCVGFFVQCIDGRTNRRKYAVWLSISLVLVLLFHVQVFAWLAIALPLMLLMTRTTGEPWLAARIPALVAVMPGVILFVVWVGLRIGQPQEIAPGQPWKSWGPMLSKENLSFNSFDQNLSDLVTIPRNPHDGSLDWSKTNFPVLAGVATSGQDKWAVMFVFAVALLISLIGRESRAANPAPALERSRIVVLFVAALGFYFLVPFDIHGYMYYLNRRYAHLAAALLVACIPPLAARWNRIGLSAAVLASAIAAVPLWQAFSAFDMESESLGALSAAADTKPRVMGLVYAPNSRFVTHPVFLHASCEVARRQGGLTNFSFALTPHSPLRYQSTPPPTFASEWRPQQMSWEAHGQYYDHFVLRGARPEHVFGSKLGTQVVVAATAGDFTLLKRRPSEIHRKSQ